MLTTVCKHVVTLYICLLRRKLSSRCCAGCILLWLPFHYKIMSHLGTLWTSDAWCWVFQLKSPGSLGESSRYTLTHQSSRVSAEHGLWDIKVKKQSKWGINLPCCSHELIGGQISWRSHKLPIGELNRAIHRTAVKKKRKFWRPG